MSYVNSKIVCVKGLPLLYNVNDTFVNINDTTMNEFLRPAPNNQLEDRTTLPTTTQRQFIADNVLGVDYTAPKLVDNVLGVDYTAPKLVDKVLEVDYTLPKLVDKVLEVDYTLPKSEDNKLGVEINTAPKLRHNKWEVDYTVPKTNKMNNKVMINTLHSIPTYANHMPLTIKPEPAHDPTLFVKAQTAKAKITVITAPSQNSEIVKRPPYVLRITPTLLGEGLCKWNIVNTELCNGMNLLGHEFCDLCLYITAACITCKEVLPCKQVSCLTINTPNPEGKWACTDHWLEEHNKNMILGTRIMCKWASKQQCTRQTEPGQEYCTDCMGLSYMVKCKECNQERPCKIDTAYWKGKGQDLLDLPWRCITDWIVEDEKLVTLLYDENTIKTTDTLQRWIDECRGIANEDVKLPWQESQILNRIICLYEGKITHIRVPAIVIEYNENMIKMIGNIAGLKFLQECQLMGDIELGQIRIVSGQGLPTQKVIITNYPRPGKFINTYEYQQIFACYYNSLEAARELGITEIAFSGSLGINKSGCTKKETTTTEMINCAYCAIRQWMMTDDNSNYMDKIILVTHKAELTDIYRKELREYFPHTGFTVTQLMENWQTIQSATDQKWCQNYQTAIGSIIGTNLIRRVSKLFKEDTRMWRRWEDKWILSLDQYNNQGGIGTIRFNNNQDNQYRGLSNMAPCKLYIGQSQYKSVEHYMQAMKYVNQGRYNDLIRQADDSKLAKRLGNEATYNIDPDYESNKYMLMINALRSKFKKSFTTEHHYWLLIRTGKNRLVESSNTAEMGEGCFGFGRNILGNMLEQIRQELDLETEEGTELTLFIANEAKDTERREINLLAAMEEIEQLDEVEKILYQGRGITPRTTPTKSIEQPRSQSTTPEKKEEIASDTTWITCETLVKNTPEPKESHSMISDLRDNSPTAWTLCSWNQYGMCNHHISSDWHRIQTDGTVTERKYTRHQLLLNKRVRQVSDTFHNIPLGQDKIITSTAQDMINRIPGTVQLIKDIQQRNTPEIVEKCINILDTAKKRQLCYECHTQIRRCESKHHTITETACKPTKSLLGINTCQDCWNKELIEPVGKEENKLCAWNIMNKCTEILQEDEMIICNKCAEQRGICQSEHHSLNDEQMIPTKNINNISVCRQCWRIEAKYPTKNTKGERRMNMNKSKTGPSIKSEKIILLVNTIDLELEEYHTDWKTDYETHSQNHHINWEQPISEALYEEELPVLTMSSEINATNQWTESYDPTHLKLLDERRNLRDSVLTIGNSRESRERLIQECRKKAEILRKHTLTFTDNKDKRRKQALNKFADKLMSTSINQAAIIKKQQVKQIQKLGDSRQDKKIKDKVEKTTTKENSEQHCNYNDSRSINCRQSMLKRCYLAPRRQDRRTDFRTPSNKDADKKFEFDFKQHADKFKKVTQEYGLETPVRRLKKRWSGINIMQAKGWIKPEDYSHSTLVADGYTNAMTYDLGLINKTVQMRERSLLSIRKEVRKNKPARAYSRVQGILLSRKKKEVAESSREHARNYQAVTRDIELLTTKGLTPVGTSISYQHRGKLYSNYHELEKLIQCLISGSDYESEQASSILNNIHIEWMNNTIQEQEDHWWKIDNEGQHHILNDEALRWAYEQFLINQGLCDIYNEETLNGEGRYERTNVIETQEDSEKTANMIHWGTVQQHILTVKLESECTIHAFQSDTYEYLSLLTMEEDINQEPTIKKSSNLTFLHSWISLVDMNITHHKPEYTTLATLLDGGASVNVITPELARLLGAKTKDISFPTRIRNAGGGVSICNKTCKIYVTVMNGVNARLGPLMIGTGDKQSDIIINKKDRMTLGITCTILSGLPVPLIIGSNAMEVFQIVDNKTQRTVTLGNELEMITIRHLPEEDWREINTQLTFKLNPVIGLQQPRGNEKVTQAVTLVMAIVNLLKACHLEGPFLEEDELDRLQKQEISVETIQKLSKKLNLTDETLQKMMNEINMKNYIDKSNKQVQTKPTLWERIFGPSKKVIVKTDNQKTPKIIWTKMETINMLEMTNNLPMGLETKPAYQGVVRNLPPEEEILETEETRMEDMKNLQDYAKLGELKSSKIKLIKKVKKAISILETPEELAKRVAIEEEAESARILEEERVELIQFKLYQETVANKLNIRSAMEASRVVIEEWNIPIDDDISELADTHTLSEDETHKPELFPKDYWKYVADDIKPLVKQFWAKFTDDRIIEVIDDLIKIDICPERPNSYPYILAQCYANLDCYYHQDENNVPYVPGFEMRIHTVDELPVLAKSFKRYTYLERVFLKLKCTDLLLRKILELSESNFRSPVMLVEYPERVKAFMELNHLNIEEALADPKNAKEIMTFYRFTMNLVMLNEKTIADQHPMPNLKNVVEMFGRSTHYSCGDVADAFWIVALAECDRHKTAFATHDQLLQWRCSVQGSKNAAVYFARMIATVFMNASTDISVYQDDIFNHTNGILKHLLAQQEIYNKMRKFTLVFKRSKGKLNYPRLKILGHIITKDGRAPDPVKIQAIIDLRPPQNPKEIKEFVGMVQWNAEFAHRLSEVLAPLNDIMHDDCDVQRDWDDAIHGKAFREVKQIFTSAPLLAMPDVFKVYRIFVDTCTTNGRGIGAILCQWHGETDYDPLNTDVSGKGWRPVAYWSKLLNKSQRKYSATEAEAKGLHDSILHWSPYLKIGQFEVVVDHKALEYIFNTENITANRRVLHYALDLRGYNYRVLYKNGKQHLNADGLSRLYRYEDILDDEQQPVKNYELVTADDIRILADKLKLDEEYVQVLIQPMMEFETRITHFNGEVAYEWVDHINDEAKQKFLTNYEQELKEIKQQRIDTTKINVAMMLDEVYMSFADNFPDDERPEIDLYEECDHLKPPLPTTFIRDRDAYLAMHLHEITEEESIMRENKVNTQTETEIRVPVAIREYRLPGVDDDEEHDVDPMIIDYVDLDPITKANENNDTGPTHRRIHNLLTGTIRYEELFYINTMEDMEQVYVGEKLTYHMTTRHKKRALEGHVVSTNDTEEDNYIPQSSKEVDKVIQEIEKVELARKRAKRPVEKPITITAKTKTTQKRNKTSKFNKIASKVDKDRRQVDDEQSGQQELNQQLSIEKNKLRQMRKDSKVKIIQLNDQERQNKIDEKTAKQKAKAEAALLKVNKLQEDLVERDERIARDKVSRTAARIQRAKTKRLEAVVKRGQSKALAKQIEEVAKDRLRRETGPRLVPTSDKSAYPEYAYETTAQQNIREEGERRARRLGEELIGSIYQHASTGRLYEVVSIFWDEATATIAAFRQPADNEISTSGDLQGWAVEGVGNIEEAIKIYNEFAGRSYSKERIRWPQNEAEMLIAQLSDTYLMSVYNNLIAGHKQYTRAGRSIVLPILATGSQGALRVLPLENELKSKHIEAFSDVATALPRGLQESALRFYHSGLGHAGTNRMEDSLRLKYWWVGMRESCVSHCSRCLICKLRKVDKRGGLLPTTRYEISQRPMQRVHIDLIGPLQSTDNGFKYVLTAKCPLTQWVEVIPLTSKACLEVTEGLTNKVYLVHGSVETLVSDNGKEFIGNIAGAVDYLMNNCHKLITAYHPAANGEIENQNGTLKDMIASYVSENQRDWDVYLPAIVHAYRTTVNTATGFSPFRALRGYEARQPAEQWIHDFRTTSQVNISTYVNRLSEALLHTWREAGARIRKNEERIDNQEPEKRVRLFRPYQVGDLFFMKSIPKRFMRSIDKRVWKLTQKLQHRYTGPHKVIAVKNPIVYKCSVNGKEKMVYAGKMKRDPAANRPFEAYEDDIMDLDEDDLEDEFEDLEEIVNRGLYSNKESINKHKDVDQIAVECEEESEEELFPSGYINSDDDEINDNLTPIMRNITQLRTKQLRRMFKNKDDVTADEQLGTNESSTGVAIGIYTREGNTVEIKDLPKNMFPPVESTEDTNDIDDEVDMNTDSDSSDEEDKEENTDSDESADSDSMDEDMILKSMRTIDPTRMYDKQVHFAEELEEIPNYEIDAKYLAEAIIKEQANIMEIIPENQIMGNRYQECQHTLTYDSVQAKLLEITSRSRIQRIPTYDNIMCEIENNNTEYIETEITKSFAQIIYYTPFSYSSTPNAIIMNTEEEENATEIVEAIELNITELIETNIMNTDQVNESEELNGNQIIEIPANIIIDTETQSDSPIQIPHYDSLNSDDMINLTTRCEMSIMTNLLTASDSEYINPPGPEIMEYLYLDDQDLSSTDDQDLSSTSDTEQMEGFMYALLTDYDISQRERNNLMTASEETQFDEESMNAYDDMLIMQERNRMEETGLLLLSEDTNNIISEDNNNTRSQTGLLTANDIILPLNDTIITTYEYNNQTQGFMEVQPEIIIESNTNEITQVEDNIINDNLNNNSENIVSEEIISPINNARPMIYRRNTRHIDLIGPIPDLSDNLNDDIEYVSIRRDPLTQMMEIIPVSSIITNNNDEQIMPTLSNKIISEHETIDNEQIMPTLVDEENNDLINIEITSTEPIHSTMRMQFFSQMISTPIIESYEQLNENTPNRIVSNLLQELLEEQNTPTRIVSQLLQEQNNLTLVAAYLRDEQVENIELMETIREQYDIILEYELVERERLIMDEATWKCNDYNPDYDDELLKTFIDEEIRERQESSTLISFKDWLGNIIQQLAQVYESANLYFNPPVSRRRRQRRRRRTNNRTRARTQITEPLNYQEEDEQVNEILEEYIQTREQSEQTMQQNIQRVNQEIENERRERNRQGNLSPIPDCRICGPGDHAIAIAPMHDRRNMSEAKNIEDIENINFPIISSEELRLHRTQVENKCKPHITRRSDLTTEDEKKGLLSNSPQTQPFRVMIDTCNERGRGDQIEMTQTNEINERNEAIRVKNLHPVRAEAIRRLRITQGTAWNNIRIVAEEKHNREQEQLVRNGELDRPAPFRFYDYASIYYLDLTIEQIQDLPEMQDTKGLLSEPKHEESKVSDAKQCESIISDEQDTKGLLSESKQEEISDEKNATENKIYKIAQEEYHHRHFLRRREAHKQSRIIQRTILNEVSNDKYHQVYEETIQMEIRYQQLVRNQAEYFMSGLNEAQRETLRESEQEVLRLTEEIRVRQQRNNHQQLIDRRNLLEQAQVRRITERLMEEDELHYNSLLNESNRQPIETMEVRVKREQEKAWAVATEKVREQRKNAKVNNETHSSCGHNTSEQQAQRTTSHIYSRTIQQSRVSEHLDIYQISRDSYRYGSEFRDIDDIDMMIREYGNERSRSQMNTEDFYFMQRVYAYYDGLTLMNNRINIGHRPPSANASQTISPKLPKMFSKTNQSCSTTGSIRSSSHVIESQGANLSKEEAMEIREEGFRIREEGDRIREEGNRIRQQNDRIRQQNDRIREQNTLIREEGIKIEAEREAREHLAKCERQVKECLADHIIPNIELRYTPSTEELTTLTTNMNNTREARDHRRYISENSHIIADSMRTNVWTTEGEIMMEFLIAYHRVRDILLTTIVQNNSSRVPLVHCRLHEEIRRIESIRQLFQDWDEENEKES